MQNSTTTSWRWLAMVALVFGLSTAATAQRTVTLTLNTATLPDTTSTMSLIEVRGAVNGEAPATLPDGNTIDWSESSTLEPANVGGDYWQTSFQIPDDQEMVFKFYSDQAETSGAGIGGWEDGDNWVIEAGTGDVELPAHFFVKGEAQEYDWRPFTVGEDSIGVWFRVYMNTEAAITSGYESGGEMEIAIRGGEFFDADTVNQGPLDWGANNVVLSREGDNDTQPGFDLYSGLAVYPASLAGMTQEYKFIVGNEGWESSDNRSFTIPSSDTTLHWVNFANSPALEGGPQTATVLFAVDLAPMEAIGIFDRGRGDTLEVRGEFNGWSCANPDNCLLDRVPGANEFEAAIPITAVPGGELQYKFFLNLNDENFRADFGIDPPSGWEEPITTTGANRVLGFDGDPNNEQDNGVQFFNDVLEGNIIPEATSVGVMFEVDMNPALDASLPQPFNPAGGDSVFVRFQDPLWSFTQTRVDGTVLLEVPAGDDTDVLFQLTDDDGDGIFTGMLPVAGPTYSGIQYLYQYGQTGAYTAEEEGSTSGIGRRRTRFINANADGTWPAEWAFPAETYQNSTPDGGYPFEGNPVATSVEQVAGEIPTTISLSDNYPNPFNPTTTFEYTVSDLM
ncbi:MAG: hypothetical protein AAGI08_07850, partial [Bacteroidota bacterium]